MSISGSEGQLSHTLSARLMYTAITARPILQLLPMALLLSSCDHLRRNTSLTVRRDSLIGDMCATLLIFGAKANNFDFPASFCFDHRAVRPQRGCFQAESLDAFP